MGVAIELPSNEQTTDPKSSSAPSHHNYPISLGKFEVSDTLNLRRTISRISDSSEQSIAVMLNAGPNRQLNKHAAIALVTDLKSYDPEKSVTLVVRIDEEELDKAGVSRSTPEAYPEYREIADALSTSSVLVRPLVQKMCNSEMEARYAVNRPDEMPPYSHLICLSHSSPLVQRLRYGLEDGVKETPGASDHHYTILFHPEKIGFRDKVSEVISFAISSALRTYSHDAVRDLVEQRGPMAKIYRFAQALKLAVIGKPST